MTTFAEAFARQAASDLEAFEYLSRSNLPACHRLHYLQMWLEKLCKAYIWLTDDMEDLRWTHNVVAKVLPLMIREHWRRIGFSQPPNLSEIREICREIDLLHPQVDDGGRRPDNVEYPWKDGRGNVFFPAAPPRPFSVLQRLEKSPTGRKLRKAAIVLTRERPIHVKGLH